MSTDDIDQHFMALAIGEARAAGATGEVPVGAVLVSADGDLIARAGNCPIASNDPTAHAEIRVLQMAGKALANYRLIGTTLYVTLEPCAMCAAAISHGRVKRLVFAAADQKGGAVLHGPKFFDQATCHWKPEISQGPFADEASALLTSFFRARRKR